MGVVDLPEFATHVLKQDVGRVCAVHHVHVHFPHAPADVDRLFEIVEKFDVAGLVEIKLFQISYRASISSSWLCQRPS